MKRADWVRCDRCIVWDDRDMNTSDYYKDKGMCRLYPEDEDKDTLTLKGDFCGQGRFVTGNAAHGHVDDLRTVAEIRGVEVEKIE